MDTNSTLLEQVALRCNVSKTTVTRSFHKNSRISAETRQQVLAAAKELGYSPRQYKKRTIKKAKKVVAIVGDCELCSNLINTISPMMSAAGIVFIAGDTGDDPKQEIAKLNELKDIVDGFFIVPCMTEDPYNLAYIKALSRQIPVLLLIRDAGIDNVSTLYFGLYENNKNAIELLIKRGHRNIAMVSNILGSKQNTDKLLAYQDALRDNGISFKGEYLLICEGKSDSIKEKVEQLLIHHPEITAIVTSNRVMTIGVLSALNEFKIKLIENIAIIANFNTKAVVNSTIPISCITVSHQMLGTMAANQMIYLLSHHQESIKTISHIAVESNFESFGTEEYPVNPISNLNLK